MNGYHPHKTAIGRKVGVMTTPARWLLSDVLNPQGIRPQSILDFGSGKSHDAEIWAQQTGAFSIGWDLPSSWVRTSDTETTICIRIGDG